MMSLRHFSLYLSLFHCLVVLVLVPIALVSHALALYEPGKVDESWSEAAWRLMQRFMAAETTTMEKFIGAFSGSYYTIDFIILWMNVHKVSSAQKYWYSLHHLFCFLGLTGPSLWYARAWDTALAFSGFFVGEVSNPPRCLADIVEAHIDEQTKKRAGETGSVQLMGRSWSLPGLRRWLRSLIRTQLVLFIAFRFVGVKMFFALLVPYGQLWITQWMGGLTLVLSLMAAVVMLRDANASTSAPKEAAQITQPSPSPDVAMQEQQDSSEFESPAAQTSTPVDGVSKKKKSRKAE